MSEIKTTFLFLHLLQMIIFLLSGYRLSKTKTSKAYWKVAIIPILTYAIVEGLRWGHMTDWNLYCQRYSFIGEGLIDDYEPFFLLLNKLFYNLGIPFYIFIFIQCAFLMYSCLSLLQDYRQYTFFSVPLLLYFIQMNENFIRWFIAISFLLLALKYLLKGNIRKTIIYYVIAFLCHYAIVIFVPLFLFKDLLNKKTVNRYVSIILIIACSFIVSISSFTLLVQMANMALGMNVGGETFMNSYLNNTEALINGQWGQGGIAEFNLSATIRCLLFNIPVVLFAPIYMKEVRYGCFFYNMAILGCILSPVFGQVEILGRITYVLNIFMTIPSSAFYTNVLREKWAKRNFRQIHRKNSTSLVKFIALISFMSGIYSPTAISWTRDDPETMKYIWDSKGQEYNTNLD